jgi:hypothetical protein
MSISSPRTVAGWPGRVDSGGLSGGVGTGRMRSSTFDGSFSCRELWTLGDWPRAYPAWPTLVVWGPIERDARQRLHQVQPDACAR